MDTLIHSNATIKLIECPRDAMQGIPAFIPTQDKIAYINLLLQVGFHTLDFGSFVSPAAIPQMRDTKEVLEGLQLTTQTKLLAIIANQRGAFEAVEHEKVSYIGYPFSISETFQQRNTNKNISSSLSLVEDLINLCDKKDKQLVIYLSMAFGNPYGDEWSIDHALHYTHELIQRGASIISLADTTGIATPSSISTLYKTLSSAFTTIEVGLHLHSTPQTVEEKIKAAYNAGCKRFDTALKGYGGCPMASDKLTGNIATEILFDFLTKNKENPDLNTDKLHEALEFSSRIFH